MPQVNVGRFAAVGDAEGTITLLKLSSNLYEPQPKEKETILEIFEREKKKAEILKKQRLENEVRKTILAKEKASKIKRVNKENKEKDKIEGIEKDFYDDVKKRFVDLGIGGDSSEEEFNLSQNKQNDEEPKAKRMDLNEDEKQKIPKYFNHLAKMKISTDRALSVFLFYGRYSQKPLWKDIKKL